MPPKCECSHCSTYRTPPEPPYAYEVTLDGQSVRYEAPTLDGLMELVRRTEPDANKPPAPVSSKPAEPTVLMCFPEDLVTARKVMAATDAEPQPTVVEVTR